MQGDEGREVQCVFTSPSEVAVQLVVDAVPQVCLLE